MVENLHLKAPLPARLVAAVKQREYLVRSVRTQPNNGLALGEEKVNTTLFHLLWGIYYIYLPNHVAYVVHVQAP